jgi:6-pyruvoyltetrahydropterin/6-carboxytetrahydropterin synthase
MARDKMSAERYHVRLTKDELGFCAAHFITFAGSLCERIHGHNYRVQAEVHGPLDENHYVVDFITLRDALKRRVDAWDHHVLLPTQHAQIRVTWDEHEVTARFEQRRWVFPREDCVLLPVANTTAELLARTLGQGLLEDLQQTGCAIPDSLQLGVDENHGQWGIWRWSAEERTA